MRVNQTWRRLPWDCCDVERFLAFKEHGLFLGVWCSTCSKVLSLIRFQMNHFQSIPGSILLSTWWLCFCACSSPEMAIIVHFGSHKTKWVQCCKISFQNVSIWKKPTYLVVVVVVVQILPKVHILIYRVSLTKMLYCKTTC